MNKQYYQDVARNEATQRIKYLTDLKERLIGKDMFFFEDLPSKGQRDSLDGMFTAIEDMISADAKYLADWKKQQTKAMKEEEEE